MKIILKLLIVAAFFAACKNEPAKKAAPATPVEATAILKHKYWVSKHYADALFSPNVMDTLYRLRCAELMFRTKDSLLMTTCLSDAGGGTYKSTGPTSIEILFDGYDKSTPAVLDEKTGILKVTPADANSAYWETEFVPYDSIAMNDMDFNNPTVQLARRRMAGTYRIVPKKGQMANAALSELQENGAAINFEGFDWFDPLPTGIGSAFSEEKEMLMVDFKKGKADVTTVCGVQLHGDTLLVYDCKNISKGDDMPLYKIKGLRAAYVKTK